MGGMVGIEWLRTYPEDFDGLILINTSVASLSHPWQRMRLQAYPRVLAAALSRDSLAREARILRLTTRLEPAAIRETARLWSNYALEYPMKRKNFLNQLLAASRYRPDQYPKTPTLVLASMRDELVSPDCSRRLAETLGAKFLLHPDAGHDLPLEDPRWLAETVIEWSRSLTNVRFSRS